MSADLNLSEVYSVKAVALMCDVSVPTVYRRLRDGTLRGHRLGEGGKILVTLSDIRESFSRYKPHQKRVTR